MHIPITFLSLFYATALTAQPTQPAATIQAASSAIEFMPVKTGMSWDYRVTFPATVQLPYQPIVEAPAGLLCASIFCGTLSWPAGTINFNITVNQSLGVINGGESFRLTVSDPGPKFYFAGKDLMEMRVRTVSGSPQLEIIQTLSIFRLVRPLARPTDADLATRQSVSVPAGDFNTVHTVVTLVGDGTYVGGTFTTDVDLAAGVGLVKAVMKDSTGKTLFTQELTKVTQAAGPQISNGGIVNAASFTPKLARGALASIFGTNLAASPTSAPSLPLTNTLGGVTVMVGANPAPPLFVSPNQINFQVPYEAAVGPAVAVTVTNGSAVSIPMNVTISDYAVGVFTYARTATALDPVIVHNSSGALVTPDNPAVPNEVLIVYGTGVGKLDHPPMTGAGVPISPLAAAVDAASITVGGLAAKVLFAGLTSGFVGLIQFNIQLPASLPAGNLPLVIQFPGDSSAAVNLAVGRGDSPPGNHP